MFGPLARFDHHTPPASDPALDPDGRSVLYVGGDLVTSAAEVFGEAGEAALCPRWRVAILRPVRPLRLLDLVVPGAAMAIGALPTLADGHHPRAVTQEWARAVYEDDPLGAHLDGIRYRTAYDGGVALVLWDSGRLVEVVASSSGEVQDFPVSDPRILARTTAGLNRRRVVVRTCGPDECPRCRWP